MKVSERKRTVTMITLLLIMGLLAVPQCVHAAPFAPAGNSDTSATLRMIDSRYASGWRAVGESYYFENCWWQRQQYYANGRPTKKVTNRKLSCPGLSFSADRIQRPSLSFGNKPGRIKR